MNNHVVTGKSRIFLLTSLLASILMSCSDETPSLDHSDYQVEILAFNDFGQNRNGSDMRISFSGALASDNVSEYRVIVARPVTDESAIIANMDALPASSYLSVTNNTEIFTVNLAASQNDFDGAEISNGVAYQAWVQTIGTFNNEAVSILTGPSEELTLTDEAIVTTLVDRIQSNDGLSVDKDGNIYASVFGVWSANGGNGTKLLKITPEGVVSEHVSGLKGPLGNAIDQENNLYIADANNGSSGNIIKIAPDGTRSVLATIKGWPAGIVVDSENNLFISNFKAPILHKIAADGTISEFVNDNRLSGSAGITLADNGNILISNFNSGDIYSITPSGEVNFLTRISGLPANFALGYIAFLNDFIYATGIGNNLIYKISLTGETEVFAGNGTANTKDGPLLEASFNNPNGIAVDKASKILYVQDWGNQALRKIYLPTE